MVVIGIDAHKRTHTAVAVDDVGRQLAHTTVKATSARHLALRRWASRWPKAARGGRGLSASDAPAGVGLAGCRRGRDARAGRS
jgi:hypothetical protein